MKKSQLVLLLAGATISLAGCSAGSDSPISNDSPPRAQAEGFTHWSKSTVFNKPADSTPEIMDTLVFNFDGNDDPNAYAELLPPTM